MHLLILLKVTFVMTIRNVTNVSNVSMHTYLVIMPSNLHHSTQNDTMQTSLVALGCESNIMIAFLTSPIVP